MFGAIGVQLFTVREQMATDFVGTLERLARMGYRGIEWGPAEMDGIAAHLDRIRELGLLPIGCHASLDQLTIGIDGLVRRLHQAGGRYAALSSRFDTLEEVQRAAELFNAIGKQLLQREIRFLYHHHNWELALIDGRPALDWLIELTDPIWVSFELDTYWLARGGADPAAYIRRLQGRCPVLHIKDVEAGDEAFFAEIGTGVLDFPSILSVAEAAGAEWLVVEQDVCRRDPLDSLALSYSNLEQLGTAVTGPYSKLEQSIHPVEER